jgi:hypothetical protein
LYLSNVLKVLYSPQKTLKEVIKNPKYIGPLLVMILLIAVNVASIYVVISKESHEQILPDGTKLDEWTENSTFWTSSNQTIITESSDAINGSIYGNASIAFSILNSSQVWMQLTGIGTVDVSVPNGFSLLSFRIKRISPVAPPENVTIQMFSFNSSSYYFYNDLTSTFSNSTYNIWNNLTIPIGPSAAWHSTGDKADWGNITGLQLQFTWAGNSNVTILVDGLFFHGPYKTLLETGGTPYLLSYAVSGAFQFAVIWVLLTGAIYILVKAFKGKIAWKPMLIAVGFILIIMFVQTLINAIGFLTWPVAHIPFELLGGVNGEGDVALKTITDQRWLGSYITMLSGILAAVWTIALVAVAVRLLAEFSWVKSIIVGIIAFTVSIMIASFIV